VRHRSKVADGALEGEDINLSLADAKEINMPVGFLDHLTEIRVMEKLSKTEYVFTNAGSVIIQIIAKNPNIAKMLESKKIKNETPDHLYA
jgi:hypothetical protein